MLTKVRCHGKAPLMLSLDQRKKTNLAADIVCLLNWLPGVSPALVKEWRMGKSNEGCLKIQLLPRERFKFSAHDGSSPASETQGPRLRSILCPAPKLGPRPPAPGPRAARLLPLLWSSHMSAAAASPPLEGGQAGAT